MVEGDELLAGYSEAVLQWKKRTQELSAAMDELKKKEQGVADAQKKLGEAQTSFDDAEKEARELEEQLDALRREYDELGAAYDDAFAANNGIDNGTNGLIGMYTRLGELETEIQQVETAYKGAQTNAREFNRKLKEQEENVDTAKDSLRQQQEAVDDLRQSVEQLEKTPEVKLFKDPTGEIDEAKEALVKMEGELDDAKAKEKELSDAYDSARTEKELAKTAQQMREVSAEAEDTKATLKKLGDELDLKHFGILNPSTIKSIGMTLSATLTPAIAGIGYKMVDASADIDSAYRDMRKTVDGTEEQFEHLRQAAIDFSRTHVTSADQILQIEAIGGELGIATENLETFAEVISNIDVATNLDTEGAATALGHLSNVLQLSEDDYVGFSDALVRLGNNGASTETEITNIAERIGSMGSIVGMSGSDILAWSSTIASTGQRAEAAGTAISKTMSYMETAVAAAGGTMDTSFDAIKAAVEEGGDKLTVFASLTGKTVEEFTDDWEKAPKDMAATIHDAVEGAKGDLQLIGDVAHMSADEFAKTWEDDPTAALKAFIEGLKDMESAGGSADKVLVDLGIKSVRQKQAIEGLMQTIGGLNDNLEMSEDAWNGVSDQWGKAGDAANEAQKKAEGFSGQMQIMKNMAQNMFAELGEGAVPWIKSITGVLQEATSLFSGLTTETKKWVVAAGGIGFAIGPLLSVAGSFGTARKEFGDWFKETTSGMNLVKLAYKHGSKDISSALDGTMKTMDKVKLVGMDLGSTLLKGLAAGAILAGIAAISYALYQLYKRYQDHIAATEGLTSAIAGIGRVSNESVGGIDNAKASIDELMMYAGKADSRLADLAQTLEDSNRQYDAYAGPLESYARTIETLGGKAELSQDETNKLAAAIQGVNDACGTNYGLDEYGNIIDTETGKIQKNTDVIRANIELRKQQALIEYYSDDYAKAIGQQEDARQTVYDLAAEYRTLRTEAGKQDWIDNYIEKTGRADLAEGAFKNHIRDTKNALEESKTEFDRTSEVVNNLDGRISDATERMNESKKAIEDAAAAQAEYERRSETVVADVSGNMKRLSDAAEKVGESDAGFNAITDSLSAISVSAKEMDKVDMSKLVSEFSDAGSSMSDIVSTLEEGDVKLSTWNAALEAAPGAAENMGSVTAAAFQAMYDSASGNLEDTMTLIAGLDAMKVDGKEFYITDNGSIFDEQGKVYDIKDDIAEIPDEVITAYYVDDKDALKKAQDAKKKADDYGKKKATAKLDAKDGASKKVDSVQGKVDKLGKTTATPTVNLRDNASGTISYISRNMRDIDGKKATVTIYEKTVRSGKQATGGMNSRPVIPEHASGYIATGPTLTNQGWIGEDGIEAVANWATGGAVVPLTNKRFMLPIADAIADGMARRMEGSGGGNYITVNVSGVASPNEVADAITRKLTLLGL
jgi:TP901 family phage tail tape measure protein